MTSKIKIESNMSEYMNKLEKRLIDEKDVSESSAKLYIYNLWNLNGKQPFKSLSFLSNKSVIDERMSGYADSTKKTIYASIMSALSLENKPRFIKLHQLYRASFLETKKAVDDVQATGKKTEKQEENWITWEQVLEIKKKLLETIESFKNKKTITETNYNTLLHYMILSLYTDIPPRRNTDFLDMYVVKKWDSSMEVSKNYLDMATNRFIFNKFKTQKELGSQIIDIPGELKASIKMFLKYHPHNISKDVKEYKFLALADGKPLVAQNAITLILNKVFGKKVGSSMLRHIYLSDKYAEIKDAQNVDAELMGHSVATQQGIYVKG